MYPATADRVHMNISAMAPAEEPDLLRRVRLDNDLLQPQGSIGIIL
jgi:hypothetical protein